jgi:NAD(P)-dependent dehydrogenase (short-subunit alcohol dehydrogenase family)
MTARVAGHADGFAWVTGASSGLGRATALALARRGWCVVATARRTDELLKLAAERIDGQGGIVAAPADTTDAAAVRAALAQAEAQTGRTCALAILNAGTYVPTKAENFDLAGWRTQIEVNLNGTATCLDAILPGMILRGRGQVAFVASIAGYRGLPDAGAYGATKAALINLAEAMRLDLAPKGIMVNLVNPGFIRTPLTDRNSFPMPFLMEVEPAAERLVEGLATGRFETTFPKRFTWILKFLRLLPYALYFPAVARFTGRR